MQLDPKACLGCLRRAWLLGLAAPFIEAALGRDEEPDPIPLLRLNTDDLLDALAQSPASPLLAMARPFNALGREHFAEELDAAGCWATCRHDDAYPEPLRDLENAPWALLGRGDPALLTTIEWKQSVAVVGEGEANDYGKEVARTLGHDLAEGVPVISGLGLGISSCVHRGALETGVAVAVLDRGPNLAPPNRPASPLGTDCQIGAIDLRAATRDRRVLMDPSREQPNHRGDFGVFGGCGGGESFRLAGYRELRSRPGQKDRRRSWTRYRVELPWNQRPDRRGRPSDSPRWRYRRGDAPDRGGSATVIKTTRLRRLPTFCTART